MDEANDRKIIQISTSESVLYALCNDGTVWNMETRFSCPKWYPMPLNPQLEETNALQK